MFCLPWAYEDGMLWCGWPDTYEDMQVEIYNNTLEWSEILDFAVAPVGWVWYEVLDELDYPLHYLHLSDWNHPSLKGSYLMACTIFSSVFRESCIGIPYYSTLSEDEVSYFQTVASNIVLDDLEFWNLYPSNEVDESVVPENLLLYQNYPNPFKTSGTGRDPATCISFNLAVPSKVNLTIYNTKGQKIKTLLNDFIEVGMHSVVWDGKNDNQKDVKSGVYLYKLSTPDFEIGNKMVLLK